MRTNSAGVALRKCNESHDRVSQKCYATSRKVLARVLSSPRLSPSPHLSLKYLSILTRTIERTMTKYILVSGGVVSGIGKGVIGIVFVYWQYQCERAYCCK